MNQSQEDVLSIDMAEQDALSQQLVEKGNVFVAKNQFDKAASMFDQAIAADSTNGAAYNNLGLTFFYQHDFHEAARAFEAAHKHLPNDPAPLNNLGLIMEMVARPSEAIELYGQAHRMAPTNPEYLGNLIRARIRMKQIDDELREQIHALLLFERRIEWQDWARVQLGLFNNPYLDRGPPKPTGDPLKGLTSSDKVEESSKSLDLNSKEPTKARSSTTTNSSSSTRRESVLELPPNTDERFPKLESLPTPIPIPEPIPERIFEPQQLDSVLERLE